MRRPARCALVVVAVATVVTGCGAGSPPEGSKAFCDAANRYNHELVAQQKAGRIDVDRQAARVEELARTAPKAIRASAQRFADAMHRVATDPSIKDDPAVKRSVDAVNRYANQACSVYSGGEKM
jgi:hypothetical protein